MRNALAGAVVAFALPLAAQEAAKPVIAGGGPQGIGLRAEPIPADAPRFEAVSIKRDVSGLMMPSGQGQLVNVQANRVRAPFITVRELIRNGYNYQHVPRNFIVNGPDWIDSERYNVEGVSTKRFGPQLVRNVPAPEAAAMIRSLLADRFKLKVHNEQREERIYELVLDRPDRGLGPGLKPSQANCLGPFDLVDLDTTTRGIVPTGEGKPYFCPFMYGYGPTSRLMASQMRMRDIAMFMGLIVSINTGVVDHTGLDGRYDINLTFAGDMDVTATAAPVPREVTPTDVLPILGAVRQQLGLKLQPIRALIDVLVIDHVERPSEN
jgi:uncharacterized protein (TIGR03435 family)